MDAWIKSRTEAMPTVGSHPRTLYVWASGWGFLFLYEELMTQHLWCKLYTMIGDYFMNKEGCLTFGGRSLVDEVNHVPRVSFVFMPHDISFRSLCIAYKCFVSFMLLCSYDHARQTDCSTLKEKGAKNVIVIILFHCMHTNSFSDHYDVAMFVDVSNTFGNFH